jgi:tyrosine-specific transport protein
VRLLDASLGQQRGIADVERSQRRGERGVAQTAPAEGSRQTTPCKGEGERGEQGRPPACTHLGDITREHEAVDAQLADAAADELRVLGAIVEDEHQAVRRAPCVRRHACTPPACLLVSHALNGAWRGGLLLPYEATLACAPPSRNRYMQRAWSFAAATTSGASVRVPRRRSSSSRGPLCRAQQKSVSPSRGKTLQVGPPTQAAVLGAAALVAGNTVGAGILALPVETAPAGVVPSLAALAATWVYSVLTGQMLAEVAIAAQQDAPPGAPPISFVSLADNTLGPWGSAASVSLQFFLQYVLQVAYTARGGDVIARLAHVPEPAGALIFTGSLALLCAAEELSPAVLNAGNGLLLVVLLLSFGALIADVVPHIDTDALLVANWSAIPGAIPIVALSFVYHNIVPLTTRSCNNDGPSITRALVLGTAVPLAMYAAWEVAVLGSSSGAGNVDPLSSGGLMVEVFSLCAVSTSYIGFTLSLVDMLLDTRLAAALRRASVPEPSLKAACIVAAAVPPCAAAIIEPGIFLKALEVAGLFGALILCGVLPGAMVIAKRRMSRSGGSDQKGYAAPGGDGAAVVVMALGLIVVGGNALHVF